MKFENKILDEIELFNLDKNFNFHNYNTNILENEIENIISGFWDNTFEHSREFEPLFTPFLQINLLRKLYIYYFSLKSLKEKYSNILVKNSNILVDIIGEYEKIKFDTNVQDHDADFYLLRKYSFCEPNKSIKEIIKKKIYTLKKYFRNKDIIYSYQLKIQNELEDLDNSICLNHISFDKKIDLKININLLKKNILNNIKKIKTSIPNILIQNLVEKRIFNSLPQAINRIEQICYYIKKNNTKLVIISCAVHEEDLVLLVAAKISNIKILVSGHGLTGCINKFLDNYIDYQVTFSPFEYKYKGAKQFKLHTEWFN